MSDVGAIASLKASMDHLAKELEHTRNRFHDLNNGFQRLDSRVPQMMKQLDDLHTSITPLLALPEKLTKQEARMDKHSNKVDRLESARDKFLGAVFIVGGAGLLTTLAATAIRDWWTKS